MHNNTNLGKGRVFSDRYKKIKPSPANVRVGILVDGQARRRVLYEKVCHPYLHVPDVPRYGLVDLRCDQVAPPRGGGDAYLVLIPTRDRHDFPICVARAAAAAAAKCRVIGCDGGRSGRRSSGRRLSLSGGGEGGKVI